MHQLSGLDALFLHLETPQMPMHVGAVHVLELPADRKPARFLRDLREHVAERLPLIPAFRRRLSWMPMNLSNPAWVESAPDLTRHVVGHKLRPGSGIADLEAAVGRLHVQLLDRSRPLWKMHVFEGLAPGPDGEARVGLYTQLHHAAVDGQAAVALAQVLLDTVPEPRDLPAVRPRREPVRLEMGEMLRGALRQQVTQLGSLARALPGAVGTLVRIGASEVVEVASSALGRRAEGGASVRNFTLAPRTRLNVPVGTSRAFATASLPLAELKATCRRLDITLNDAVLVLCSGALRRFFQRHGPLPRKPMIAAVPISLRATGDGASNNQASITLVSLGTHLADPGKRLAHVRAATAAMKATMASDRVRGLLPTDFPSIGVPWLLQGLTRMVGTATVAERIPPVANLVISNVPGPPVPLYLAGARMRTNFPASIVVHGVALNITVQTYADALDIGLMADGEAMPQVSELAASLETAFEELKALPSPSARSPRRPVPEPAAEAPAPRRARPKTGGAASARARPASGAARPRRST